MQGQREIKRNYEEENQEWLQKWLRLKKNPWEDHLLRTEKGGSLGNSFSNWFFFMKTRNGLNIVCMNRRYF